jgi:hypothetical protein
VRRKSSNPNLNFWTGYLDGPPIASCREAAMLRRNAIDGSQRLASTIKMLGLRP